MSKSSKGVLVDHVLLSVAIVAILSANCWLGQRAQHFLKSLKQLCQLPYYFYLELFWKLKIKRVMYIKVFQDES